ncbi:hypothetical protein ACFQ0T_05000 [Kitasatospora gansuensis]
MTTAVALLSLTAVAVLPGDGDTLVPVAEQPVSGAFMERTVRTLLPPGTVSKVQTTGLAEARPPGTGPGLALTFDDGHGPTRIQLSTERMALPIDGNTQGTECVIGDQPGTCERLVLADRTIVLTRQLTERQGPVTGGRTVLATGPDGRQVRLDAFDDGPGQPDTGAEGSLSVPQLVGIAISEAWDPVFRALDTPRYPKDAFSGLPAARIAAIAVPLLPAGTTAKIPEGRFADGRSELTLTGQGRQVVLDISAQHVGVITREAFEAGAAPGTVTHTADGTSVVRREVQPDSDLNGPVVSWAVEALHPDGTRVSAVQSVPGTWPDVPPLPGREVLTMDQLVALVAAPVWRG